MAAQVEHQWVKTPAERQAAKQRLRHAKYVKLRRRHLSNEVADLVEEVACLVQAVDSLTEFIEEMRDETRAAV